MTTLRLFARDGYEVVSVGTITGELTMVLYGAINKKSGGRNEYKQHYHTFREKRRISRSGKFSKRKFLECISSRML